MPALQKVFSDSTRKPHLRPVTTYLLSNVLTQCDSKFISAIIPNKIIHGLEATKSLFNRQLLFLLLLLYVRAKRKEVGLHLLEEIICLLDYNDCKTWNLINMKIAFSLCLCQINRLQIFCLNLPLFSFSFSIFFISFLLG